MIFTVDTKGTESQEQPQQQHIVLMWYFEFN